MKHLRLLSIPEIEVDVTNARNGAYTELWKLIKTFRELVGEDKFLDEDSCTVHLFAQGDLREYGSSRKIHASAIPLRIKYLNLTSTNNRVTINYLNENIVIDFRSVEVLIIKYVPNKEKHDDAEN